MSNLARMNPWPLPRESLESLMGSEIQLVQVGSEDPTYLWIPIVGGWTNPSEKICASQIPSFPQVSRGENKKIFKTTT